MAKLTLEALKNNKLSVPYDEAVRILIEGLLAHFFNPNRQCYHVDDIRWFLHLANSQRAWGCDQLEEVHEFVGNLQSGELSAQAKESLDSTNVCYMWSAFF